MPNPMDRYLVSNVRHIAKLKRSAQTVEARIDEAIQRMQIAVSDSYDRVLVFYICWKSDDIGVEDSSLFVDTLSKLQNVKLYQRSLDDVVTPTLTLAGEITEAASRLSERRKLLILHYVDHDIAGSTPDTTKIGQELDDGPKMNISLVKVMLEDFASKSSGLDVLLVIDAHCAGIVGGEMAKGARVELVVATARNRISNSKKDGRSFTQHWCEAFTRLLEIGEPFTCDDIVKHITPDSELPATFVLREGWDLPITFHLHPSPIASTLPVAVTSRTVVIAFLIEENPDSTSLKKLIKYLDEAPVKIRVLGVLQIPNTLLLLRVPVFLKDLLVLPLVTLFITDS